MMTVNAAHTLFSLKSTNILITGGGTGLGYAMAEAYLQQGARVLLASRREAVLSDAVVTLTNTYGAERVAYVCMDMACQISIEQALPKIWTWGEIDVLVNNAGRVHNADLLTLDASSWDDVNAVNIKGVWLLSRALVSRFNERIDRGNSATQGLSIINVTSILGMAHMIRAGLYGMSKASLIYLTKQMALEWSEYGVRVNAIEPGFVYTDMTDELLQSRLSDALLKHVPMARFGVVEDVCGVAVLLASRASAYMTGSVIPVDGGHSIAQVMS
ncbi:MAG: SDR family oxidoreductase [Pseudomonadota bacterium]